MVSCCLFHRCLLMFPDHIYISHQDWKGNVYKVILARMLEREKMGMCKAWMSFTNFWANLPNEFKTGNFIFWKWHTTFWASQRSNSDCSCSMHVCYWNCTPIKQNSSQMLNYLPGTQINLQCITANKQKMTPGVSKCKVMEEKILSCYCNNWL